MRRVVFVYIVVLRVIQWFESTRTQGCSRWATRRLGRGQHLHGRGAEQARPTAAPVLLGQLA